MITIRPSTVESDGLLETSPPSDPEEHKKRVPLLWIPATLSVGLLIAAIYLGGRIVTGHPHSSIAIPHTARVPPPPAQSTPVQAVIVPPAVPAPIETKVKPQATVSAAELAPEESPDAMPMITPLVGELYIQVGALNPEGAGRLVQRLRNEKLEPHVAEGPTPELMRVLIGPFQDPNALIARKAQLETEGIDTYVRKY
jgi:cell division septation protein DedD